MSGKPVTLAFASMAALALLAGPADAGGRYGPGAYSAHCNCYMPQPRVRVVYGAQPVTYYVAREVYVPKRVYVKKRAYVQTPMFIIDQGPSFDLPAVPYTLPRVYWTKKRPYPYGSSHPGRVHRHHVRHKHRYRGHRHVHRAASRHHGSRVHGRAASRAGK
jgi:hypothetical protein